MKDPKWMYSEQIIHYIDVLLQVGNGNTSGAEVIAKAKRIDSELTIITANMPARWLYDMIQITT